jgi:prepilin-type N-terminal cleavage/methylation domain-containing protein
VGTSANGFTLVEVLVATAVLSIGVLAIGHLAVLSAMSNGRSRDASYAALLASQKLHELDADVVPALPLSAPDAWMRSAEPTTELLDAAGHVLADDAGSAIYVRRWSVTPIPGDPAGGIALQVSVGRLRRDSANAVADAVPWEVARVVGVRTGVVP